MRDRVVVSSVETFIVSLPRDVPYLGPLGPGESVNAKGYFVRRGNRFREMLLRLSVVAFEIKRSSRRQVRLVGVRGLFEHLGVKSKRFVLLPFPT